MRIWSSSVHYVVLSYISLDIARHATSSFTRDLLYLVLIIFGRGAADDRSVRLDAVIYVVSVASGRHTCVRKRPRITARHCMPLSTRLVMMMNSMRTTETVTAGSYCRPQRNGALVVFTPYSSVFFGSSTRLRRARHKRAAGRLARG